MDADEAEAETAEGQEAEAAEGQEAEAVEGQEAEAVEGQEAEAVEGQEAEAAEGQEAETAEGQEAPAADGVESAVATAVDKIKSTTVMNPGDVYSIVQDMKMYAEPSTASDVIMDISGAAGWSVAIEEAAKEGNGWHRVSVWLEGAPTYGYIQIP